MWNFLIKKGSAIFFYHCVPCVQLGVCREKISLYKSIFIIFLSLLSIKIVITYLGAISEPCCMRLPQLCQKQLCRVSSFSSSSGSSTQGCGFSHSQGVSLKYTDVPQTRLLTTTKISWPATSITRQKTAVECLGVVQNKRRERVADCILYIANFIIQVLNSYMYFTALYCTSFWEILAHLSVQR